MNKIKSYVLLNVKVFIKERRKIDFDEFRWFLNKTANN